MKIGISIPADDKLGYGRFGDMLYKKIKEHGYDCIDYNMASTNSLIYTSSLEELKLLLSRQKELAEEAGVKIHQVHGPWRWPVQDFSEDDRRERMEKMKRSICSAALLGCKNWVIHPIMPYGLSDINTEEEKKTWDINLAFMKELLKTAKEHDVTICLENMPFGEFSMATPESIIQFVNEIDDEHFKICLDTGHVAVFENLSLGDTVKLLGNKIQVLHVHDNRCSIDLHMMPYFGVVDWDEFAQGLKEIDFKGVFSLETEPSHKLPTPIFEDMSIALAKIAKEIVKDI